MIPIQRIARFAAVFGILALAPVSRASAACPENMIFFGCYPDAVGYSYTEPTSDYNGEPWQIGDPCPIGCYDLHIGTIHTEARGNTAGPGCLAGVHTEDSFTIIGIPAGTPVNFFAEFQVTGSLSGPGSVGATVYDNLPGGPSATNGTNTPDPSMHFTVHLPLSHLAGDAFRIRADLNVGGDFPDGVAVADGVLRFGGLPAGAIVHSCQNYDLPVPTLPASWGALKAAYR